MKNCKGCCMQGKHSTSFSQGLTNSDICPCSICIVKAMCRESCEEYITFCDFVVNRGEYINEKL